MKSVFFSNYDNDGEQQLLHDLVEESINIYGNEVQYLPRRRGNFDKLLGADDVSSFDTAYQIPMYIVSFEGFQGDQVFLSRFGLEIRDRVIFQVARRTFENEVVANEDFVRPREGDLIYFPLNKKCFQIMFVDYLPVFYPMGTLPSYKLICELFEYSNETFKTGIEEIDSIQKNLSTDILTYALRNENGDVLTNEDGLPIVTEAYSQSSSVAQSDNQELQVLGDDLLDFSELNPFNDSQVY